MNSSPESAEKSSGSRVKSGFLMHLHRKGIIYLDERNALLSQCSTKGLYIEDLLEYLDLPEREVYERLAEFCGLPLLDINQLFVSTELLSMIPAHELRQMMILPMYLVNEELTIACAMPLEQKSMLHLKKNTGLNHFIQVLVPFSELTSLLDQYLSDDDRGAGVQSIIARLHDQIALGISEKHGVDETSLPIIPLVNAILESALKAGASDIHFEPRENVYAVRFRIDGQLQEMFSLPQMAQDAVIARLKVISNLNIIERYRPQDGQITIPYKNKTIEFRINFLRTVWGEKACLRILDRESVRVQLLTLGLENDNQLPLIMDLCKRPNGLIIVCGATGSGKSTTLFSMLNEINTEDVNIVTVEDPSEYRIDRINQCSVIKERGLDFHSALKAILRQDPDIIMLGEIRDLETAEIAFRAALTGHLVLATLHTNDSISAIERLIDLGLDPPMIALGLSGIIAQSLVRKICKNCREFYSPNVHIQQILGLTSMKNLTFARGKGCEECNGKGTKGRIGIYEVLIISEEIQKHIALNRPYDEIKKAAILEGWHPLRFSAVRKVLRHQTTVEEIIGMLH